MIGWVWGWVVRNIAVANHGLLRHTDFARAGPRGARTTGEAALRLPRRLVYLR